MAFGFPAYHEERFVNSSDEAINLKAAALKAVRTLNWKIKSNDGSRIIAMTSMNLSSWGEWFHITMTGPRGMTIRSECSATTQFVDWGKNKRNVRKFLTQLEEQIASSPATTLSDADLFE